MKSQWEEETEKSMADLRTVLSETQKSLDDTVAELAVTRTSLEELRASSVADVHRLEEELNLAWADRDAAASQYLPMLFMNLTCYLRRRTCLSRTMLT